MAGEDRQSVAAEERWPEHELHRMGSGAREASDKVSMLVITKWAMKDLPVGTNEPDPSLRGWPR
jgi:hypothetical protein